MRYKRFFRTLLVLLLVSVTWTGCGTPLAPSIPHEVNVDVVEMEEDGAGDDEREEEAPVKEPIAQRENLLPANGAVTFERAEQAVENMRIGWSVGNSLDSIGVAGSDPAAIERAWGNPLITKELIRAVKEAGFNSVRVPVTWYLNMDEEGRVDEAWMNRVEEVVNMVLSEGMYCILNVHHDTGNGQRWLRADVDAYDAISRRYVFLWEQIASRFANYNERLLFESFNEITDRHSTLLEPSGTPEEIEGAYQAVNDLNQLFVDTVRKTGGGNVERNLICNPYFASIHLEPIEHFSLPFDSVEERLIAQVHCYCPFEFTFKEEQHGPPTAWFDQSARDTIDGIFSMLETHFTDEGIPLILGEFGAMNKDNTQQRALYAHYVVKRAREIGMVCFWWDNGKREEFMLFNRRQYTIVAPEIVEGMMQALEE